ncbi:hypothetical protein AGMMS50276_32860 [Synergistales bacterium]|nr:hypothetical protein AGMMS50276_32860 [Synergistales bacterium]
MYISIAEKYYTAKGIKKGKAEGKAEVARNMLNDGLPVERVVQYTNLPREDVERLLN